MADKKVFPDIVQWDWIKLREVWQEFNWHVRKCGARELGHLSAHNQRVYHELKNELNRRGEQLSLFYGVSE